MRQTDNHRFVKAMMKELFDHDSRGHWEIKTRAELNYPKTIMSIWSFKCKRLPNGDISKYKARLCAHGGQQQWGVQYWETYSPVVSWMAVRTLLVLSKIHGLHTKCIDFTLAIPKADVKVPIYLHTPTGIQLDESESHDKMVLKLKKNLYGLRDAGRT